MKIYIKGHCNSHASASAYIIQYGNDRYYETYHSACSNPFEAEVIALGRALVFMIKMYPSVTKVEVFTNNQPLVAILSEERYGYDYDKVLHRLWDVIKKAGIDMCVNWFPKKENTGTDMESVDKLALNAL